MLTDITDIYTSRTRKLLYDEYYYANVFKKTEKICHTVYFIAARIRDSFGESSILTTVEKSALRLLEDVHASLTELSENLPHIAYNLSLAIIDLRAKLGILNATGLLSREHFAVFDEACDTLERSIHFHTPQTPTLQQNTPIPARTPEKKRIPSKKEQAHTPTPTESTATTSPEKHTRRTQIKDILTRTDAIPIKDIARAFPNVSEKTIQRELNGMIDDGIVRKEGAKRWSRYVLL